MWFFPFELSVLTFNYVTIRHENVEAVGDHVRKMRGASTIGHVVSICFM